MRAAVLWTISDFPGYAMLSGWSTKGHLACPSCHKYTHSKWLRHGRKFCYLGHRRFLHANHVFQRYKESFDNTQEFRDAPKPLSGSEVLQELEGKQVIFGKSSENDPLPHSWKKCSIFFELPYWKDNILRHNLDVMHIEKNVCDNILWTLLNVNGRSKDNVNSRLDMQLMGIRRNLHPTRHVSGKLRVPIATFRLNTKEKDTFFKVLKSVKVPDGYAGNIARCVNLKQRKIYGLKSHDSHILMQQILPLALRRILPRSISKPLILLCSFFKELCSKVGQLENLNNLEAQIADTLCHLERIFPPSFFDIMIHLTIHLTYEAKLGGPVQARRMYPVERFLSTLKSYVGNKAKPEGSIANGYIAEECLTFCSKYLHGVETRSNRPSRNDDNLDSENGTQDASTIFPKIGRSILHEDIVDLGNELLAKAHHYVLTNCNDVAVFIEEHLSLLKSQYPRKTPHAVQVLHNSTFQPWFAQKVYGDNLNISPEKLRELKRLARPPNSVAKSFKGFIINGFRFHTRELEKTRKTQNCGVMVTATTQSFASARDHNPIYSDVSYYGIIEDILELDFNAGNKVVLFRCDWVSTGRGLKCDELGFTLVNFSNRLSDKDPFIMASQAQQVFYVRDPIDTNWQVVIKTKPRDLYDMGEEEVTDVDADVVFQSSEDVFPEDIPNTRLLDPSHLLMVGKYHIVGSSGGYMDH
ncbi:unnamed protein product [Linum trigynum]|uniref:Transposase n=1 Tax=Linum trigynum TaxID=586398 RepID=A0AAV2CXE7_9ROSI